MGRALFFFIASRSSSKFSFLLLLLVLNVGFNKTFPVAYLTVRLPLIHTHHIYHLESAVKLTSQTHIVWELFLVTLCWFAAVDELASCIWVWPKGGASALDVMLLDCICDFHELVP